MNTWVADIQVAVEARLWAKDAELWHRANGHYEQAVAFQQMAYAIERHGIGALECEFIGHEAAESKGRML